MVIQRCCLMVLLLAFYGIPKSCVFQKDLPVIFISEKTLITLTMQNYYNELLMNLESL